MKCFVYRNLHRPGYYSIKALEGHNKGRVVGYAPEMDILNPVFKVSQAGRLRVLLTRQKNVHAGVVGDVCNVLGYVPNFDYEDNSVERRECFINLKKAPELVTYNPYKYSSFVYLGSKLPIHTAWMAHLSISGVSVYP